MPAFAPFEIDPLESGPAAPGRGVKLAELRQLLGDKYPAQPARKGAHFRTGLEQIDRMQGLPRAAVTEICGSLGTGSLLIAALARAAQRARCYCALVDGGRSFDTFDLPPKVLKRVLWVLCEGAEQAIKAADLLLRDGNLPLVILDLQPLPVAQLRRIPASTWHRFHRVAEQGNTAFVAVTPRPMVEGVRLRIAAGSGWRLGAMTQRRQRLVQELALQIFDKSAFIAVLDRQLKTA